MRPEKAEGRPRLHSSWGELARADILLAVATTTGAGRGGEQHKPPRGGVICPGADGGSALGPTGIRGGPDSVGGDNQHSRGRTSMLIGDGTWIPWVAPWRPWAQISQKNNEAPHSEKKVGCRSTWRSTAESGRVACVPRGLKALWGRSPGCVQDGRRSEILLRDACRERLCPSRPRSHVVRTPRILMETVAGIPDAGQFAHIGPLEERPTRRAVFVPTAWTIGAAAGEI